jgi:hypothetical protein
MATGEMQRVYRLLKEAREQDIIPWEWIVDESRMLERVSSWDDPEQYARCVINSYRRDYVTGFFSVLAEWSRNDAGKPVASDDKEVRHDR